ncbi:hypothetical protein EVAR_103941_1 [Eumeta japonica]|uniref:Uncharacterized protein n=1 Tax=Eumeta variegata TaxID=151549 RepID=A0A4C1YF51_EUMVA|nr:hypothetical protein EVAR_103941_1 [Eumeta japonica]
MIYHDIVSYERSYGEAEVQLQVSHTFIRAELLGQSSACVPELLMAVDQKLPEPLGLDTHPLTWVYDTSHTVINVNNVQIALTEPLRPGKLKKTSGPFRCGIWRRTFNSFAECRGCARTTHQQNAAFKVTPGILTKLNENHAADAGIEVATNRVQNKYTTLYETDVVTHARGLIERLGARLPQAPRRRGHAARSRGRIWCLLTCPFRGLKYYSTELSTPPRWNVQMLLN